MFRMKMPRFDEIYRNIIVQSSGTILSQLIPVAVSPLLTRIYSPEQMGLYGLIVLVSALMAIVFALRIDHGVVVAPSDAAAAEIVSLSLVMASASAAAFSVASLAFILVVWGPGDGSFILAWVLLAPLAGFTASALRTLTLWNNRIKNFPKVSKSRIYRSLWTAAASIAAGMLQTGLILGLIAGNVLAALMLGRNLPFRAVGFRRAREIFVSLRDFVRFSVPADLINVASSRAPLLIFPVLFGLEQTGFLALTYLVIATPTRFVGTAIGEVFYSHAAREYESSGNCRASMLKVVGLLAALGVPAFTILYLFADYLFRTGFGVEWAPAAGFAKILIPMILVNFIVSPVSFVFYIAGRQKVDLVWQLVYLVAAVGSCYLGYWIGGTAVHSLLALSATGTLMYLIYFVLVYRYAGVSRPPLDGVV